MSALDESAFHLKQDMKQIVWDILKRQEDILREQYMGTKSTQWEEVAKERAVQIAKLEHALEEEKRIVIDLRKRLQEQSRTEHILQQQPKGKQEQWNGGGMDVSVDGPLELDQYDFVQSVEMRSSSSLDADYRVEGSQILAAHYECIEPVETGRDFDLMESYGSDLSLSGSLCISVENSHAIYQYENIETAVTK